MSFDFEVAFSNALSAGLAAAKSGGKPAKDWIEQSARANERSLRLIAEGVLSDDISKKAAAALLQESARALESEAAALQALMKASVQAGVNAFLQSLLGAFKTGLKVGL